MKILSIDVGMKNCAYCLLNTDISKNYIIEKWDIIDLCESSKETCQGFLKNGKKCSKHAKYTKHNTFYCKTHAKKYKIPPTCFSCKKIKKLKKDKLVCVANEYDISFNSKDKKEIILNDVLLDLSNNYYDFVSNILTTEKDMIFYGIKIKKLFNKTFSNIDIDLVVIENQIGPLALRMKTLQGMIMQHFIENDIINVVPVNSNNKLKDFLGSKKTSYDERKRESINITRKLMQNTNWINHFESHKKKDDLADCFLQAKWYISHRLK
tara:strand:- start:2982 stop:3779 length:798 start_codon:yes stop_codon:yes gene_type:complete